MTLAIENMEGGVVELPEGTSINFNPDSQREVVVISESSGRGFFHKVYDGNSYNSELSRGLVNVGDEAIQIGLLRLLAK